MEQNHFFRREIKIQEEDEPTEDNLVTIVESSHPMYGTGSKVWESSVVLAKALAYMSEENVYPMQNKTVLELGCGAGLLSIFLAALKANVIATDLPIVQPLLDRNINNNRIVIQDRLRFQPYNWLQEYPLSGQKIDYVVASEPFVSQQAIVAFLKSISRILQENKPISKAFIAFKIKDNDLNKFAEVLQQYGLHEQRWPEDDKHPDFADPRVGIYSVRRI